MPPPEDKPAVKASRDAKRLAGDLQAVLKSKPLESNDVEFSRQSLRKAYQDMLFAPRSAGGTSPGKMLDILSLLWMDTTHAIIARYRSKITQLDKAIAENPQPEQHRGRGRGRKGAQQAEGGHQGPVARRRVVQAFRSFLSKEEEYWTSLLVKMINSFDVSQAAPCLSALGISASVVTASTSERSNGETSEDIGRAADRVPSKIALLLCHRNLISLGDLARYRDLYSETAKPQTKRGASTETGRQDRSFAKAQECYNQARRLIPEDGQPFNQLAVLSSYEGDQLSLVYYYLRAGCVKQYFKTAQPNLEMTLTKALKKYEDVPVDPSIQTPQLFANDFVALQAMIYLQKTDPVVVENQLRDSLKLYTACLSSRSLAAEVILKVICTCIATWHSDRMPHNSPAADALTKPSKKSDNEGMVLQLVLGYLGATFREAGQSVEGMFEGKIPTEPASRETVASRISPLLRRALPAIRVGSKWLLSKTSNGRLAIYGKHVSAFWNDYATLVNVLARRFPNRYLPDMPNELVLEENVDLAGFLPLGGALRSPGLGQGLTAAQEAGASSHPNYEHLMRIADILSDAALIASSETTPVSLERGSFAVKFELNPTAQQFQPPNFVLPPSRDAAAPGASSAVASSSDDDEEEDEVLLRDVSAAHLLETHQYQDDSDVVDLAMRAATMNHSHDGHAEEILNPSTASPRLTGLPLPEPQRLAGAKSTSPAPGNEDASALLSNIFSNSSHKNASSPGSFGSAALPLPSDSISPSPSLRSQGLPPPSSVTGMPNSIWGPAPSGASMGLPPPADPSRTLWNYQPEPTGHGAFGAAPLRRGSRGISQPPTSYNGTFG